MRFLERRFHVRVTSAVVQNEAADQARFILSPVLHPHNFHHVQVDLFALFCDTEYRIHTNVCKLLGHFLRQLCGQSSACHVRESRAGVGLVAHFARLQYLQRLLLRQLKTRPPGHGDADLRSRYISACFSSSPISRTVDVVPSPVSSF